MDNVQKRVNPTARLLKIRAGQT